jgi:hypothetical protein
MADGVPSIRPDYDKINLLKKIRGKMESSKRIGGINANYKGVIHDLELLKETKYLTEKEYEEEVRKLKDRYIELALTCNEGYED